MTKLTPQSAENKIRFHQTRKAILHKLYQLFKDHPGLNEDKTLARMEIETSALFDQMLDLCQPADSASYLKPHHRPRKLLHPRTEHVGRFFIHAIEHQLHLADLPPCTIPVLAGSVSRLIGTEAYNQFSEKINHLIMFADANDFDYNQMLESKPGRDVTRSILKLYRNEIQMNPNFEEKLGNQLDEVLVEYASLHPEKKLNIEESIEKSIKAFMQLLRENPSGISS